MANFDYDVALSFAGEDRMYVDQVAAVLHQIGVKVFYDKYEEVDLWGKNLFNHLDDVYQKRSKYCVIFASQHYAKKLWTNHERESAQARAFGQKSEYILPVRFDDTEIPGVRPTTGYVNLKHKTSSELAYLIAEKVGIGTEINEMIEYLADHLADYKIEAKGTELQFDCDVQDWHGSFPIRLMLEMYRADQLLNMFLFPAIVPH